MAKFKTVISGRFYSVQRDISMPTIRAGHGYATLVARDYTQKRGRREMFEKFHKRQASRRVPVTSA